MVLFLVDNSVWFCKKGMCIDLGGIVKGYVVDNVIVILQVVGVESVIVIVGGDSCIFGDYWGWFWLLGIYNLCGDGQVFKLLLEDVLIFILGDYEWYFEVDGVWYYYIIDLYKGVFFSELMSVSVLMDKFIDVDVLFMMLFVLGIDKVFKLVNL